MPAVFERKADEFVDTMNDLLNELSGRNDHRGDCTIEAANLVSAVIDADGRHTDQELDMWVETLGRKLTPPMILTPSQLRDDNTLGGSAQWLTKPSTMFDLLVKADARDLKRRANAYYTYALSVAHATAAIDLDADPNFERTLGILTKIDLMDKYGDLDRANRTRRGQHKPPSGPSLPKPRKSSFHLNVRSRNYSRNSTR